MSVSGADACAWGRVGGFWPGAFSAWDCSLFLFLGFCCAGGSLDSGVLAAPRIAKAPSCSALGTPLAQAQAAPRTCKSTLRASSSQSLRFQLKTHRVSIARFPLADCIPAGVLGGSIRPALHAYTCGLGMESLHAGMAQVLCFEPPSSCHCPAALLCCRTAAVSMCQLTVPALQAHRCRSRVESVHAGRGVPEKLRVTRISQKPRPSQTACAGRMCYIW